MSTEKSLLEQIQKCGITPGMEWKIPILQNELIVLLLEDKVLFENKLQSLNLLSRLNPILARCLTLPEGHVPREISEEILEVHLRILR
jgi:hypothetical protein